MNTITRDEVKRLSDASGDTTLLNVLGREQYETEHIPGSLSAPGSDPDFVKTVESMVGGKDKPIVTYCASKDCPASRQAAERLIGAGFTNVRAYEGGMKEWKDAKMPMEVGSGSFTS